jgi:hypothetical protein
MQHLREARPPHLDDVDSRVDWQSIMDRPHTRTRTPRRALKWGFAGAGLIAAAVVTLTVITAQPTPAPTPERTTAEALTPRQALHVAATNALGTRSTGRYFVSKKESGYVFAADGYEVLARYYREYWHPRSGKDRVFQNFQNLGAAPFGPGSEAAWRADGSPTSWTLPGTGKNPEPTKVTAAAGPRTTTRDGKRQKPAWGNRVFALGGRIMSAEAMAALPTDAAGLRAWLTRAYRDEPDPSMTEAERLIQDTLQLLTQMPVTGRVRSAAYGMLADFDTARLTPTATDQRGRTGTAVTIPVDYEDGVTTLRVIFSEKTGDMLSVEQLTSAGRLRGYDLFVSLGWTDERPS